MAPAALWGAAIFFLLPSAGALHEVALHASGWTLENANGSIRVEVANASSTHLNLMEAGLLRGDPYYRYNELAWSWVAKERWTYRTSFPSTPEMLSHRHKVIRCQIDTVATLVLNGQEVGSTSNMFVVHEFDVSDLLRPAGSANALEVRIRPALEYAAEQAGSYPYPVPASVYYHTWVEGPSPDFAGNATGTSAHRNFVRKVPSDFGWDWGPAFVPSGITSLSLVSRAAGSLAGVSVRQRHAGGAVVLTLEARLAVVAACRGSLAATLRSPSGVSAEPLLAAAELAELQAGAHTALLELRVERPELWWPVGMGSQPLYDLELRFRTDVGGQADKAAAAGGAAQGGTHGESAVAADESVLRRRVGLRTAELVQEPAPGGSSFLFRVNGEDVFVKGSNFIPADVFAPRATRDLGWILRSAVDANMNMVRVWGGGLYQPDEFYDLADELGLMVWQEMVFACALYPRDPAFLASVTEEVEQQALRLQHHASIVVWGGNNENEGALHWYALSERMRDRYLVDYAALYIETALPALRGVDPDVAFTDSSPSNGVVSEKPYTKRWGDVSDVRWGDVHYYNYGADCEDHTTYPPARFVSEHGFQSFPSFRTYRDVLSPEDWAHNSSQLFWRQRHPSGQEQMKAMLERHFRVPPERADSPAGQREVFDSYLYLTQVQQARCYETAFAQWRRLRSDPQVGTMGILYWQLNDIWPGPSWSSLEHTGTWRLTHSAVQRAFAPVLVSLLVVNGTLQVFFTSDLRAGVTVTVDVQLRAWRDGQAHHWFSCTDAPKSETRMGCSRTLSSAMHGTGCSHETCFVYANGTTDEDPPRHLSAHAFLTPLKDAQLPRARLTASGPRKLGPRRASLRLASDAVAVYAALESDVAGRFNPNALLLLPGEPLEVEFLGRQDFEVGAWARGIRVRSLRDTYGDVSGQEEPVLVA